MIPGQTLYTFTLTYSSKHDYSVPKTPGGPIGCGVISIRSKGKFVGFDNGNILMEYNIWDKEQEKLVEVCRSEQYSEYDPVVTVGDGSVSVKYILEIDRPTPIQYKLMKNAMDEEMKKLNATKHNLDILHKANWFG